MNFFPTPPTDNLYKFLAILGAWGMLIAAGFLALLAHQNYETEKFEKKRMAFFQGENWIATAERRINSLKFNRTNENKIEGLSNLVKPSEELSMLSKQLELAKEYRAELKKVLEKEPNNDLPFLRTVGILNWFYGLLVGSGAFLCVGFISWMRLQKIADDLLRLDLQLKKAQLKNERRR